MVDSQNLEPSQISQSLHNSRFIAIQPNSKHPLIENGEDWNNALLDFAQAQQQIQAGNNTALVCGQNGFVCIDCDDLRLALTCEQLLPLTYQETTPSGGAHFIYLMSGQQFENFGIKSKGQHLGELRCSRQYVVVAPSKAPSKKDNQIKPYVCNDLPCAEVTPEQIKEVLQQFDTPSQDSLGKISKDVADSLQSDEKLWKIYQGDITGYPSRSEAEQALVNMLVSRDFDKTQIFQIMASCKIGKWQEKPLSYRNLTYTKAVCLIAEKKGGWEDGKPIKSNNSLFMNFGELSQKKFKNDFIIESHFRPGDICMLDGESGVGKSFIAEYMAAVISKGVKFLGVYRSKKCRVGILDKENGEQLIQKRLQMIKRGLKARTFRNLFILRQEQRGMLDDLKWMGDLIAQIKALNIKVLILDTLHRFSDYEENSSDSINNFYLTALMPIVQQTGCTLILIHHQGKKAKSTYRGSSDLKGILDFELNISRDNRGFYWLNYAKVRDGQQKESVAFNFDFSNDAFQIKLFSRIKDDSTQKSSKELALSQTILKNMGESPIKRENLVKLISKEVNFSRACFTRALKILINQQKIKSVERGIYVKSI